MRDIARSIGQRVVENVGRAAGRFQENTPLPADLLESDDAYLVVFDAPGAEARDVQVQYVDDRIEVRIDRFRDLRQEFELRYPGRGLTLEGSVTLPTDAVVDAATATAALTESGTLQVTVPKREPTEDEESGIDVESGDGESGDGESGDGESGDGERSDDEGETPGEAAGTDTADDADVV